MPAPLRAIVVLSAALGACTTLYEPAEPAGAGGPGAAGGDVVADVVADASEAGASGADAGARGDAAGGGGADAVVGGDGGLADTAGSGDSGDDAGTRDDAGGGADSGVVDALQTDGGADGPTDSGGLPEVGEDVAPDVGLIDDGGVSVDVGAPGDAGTLADAGVPTDAGTLADAGVQTDAGAPVDTGAPVDAGASPGDDAAIPDTTTWPDVAAASDAGVDADASDVADALYVTPTWEPVLDLGFDEDHLKLAGHDGWDSTLCSDPWRSKGGRALAVDDSGCSCSFLQEGCAWDVGDKPCAQQSPLSRFLVNGDPGWQDTRVEVWLDHADDDALGVALRFEDPGNTWLVLMTRDLGPSPETGCEKSGGPRTQILRITDGQATLVAQQPDAYPVGEPFLLRLTAEGPFLTLEAEDLEGPVVPPLVFDMAGGPDAGRMGLYANQSGIGDGPCKSGGCGFDRVRVSVPAP